MRRKFTTVERLCDACSTPFTTDAGRIADGRGRFCSQPCVLAARAARARDPEVIAARFWKFVRKSTEPDGCWEWQGSTLHGYGQFMWYSRIPRGAHRVSWEMVYGPVPDGLWVLHRCDNRPCVRLNHLFLGTSQDNTADMVAKGRGTIGDRNPSRLYPDRVVRGERHPFAKLTDAQVEEIRARVAAGGVTHQQLATEYGVNRPHIGRIIRRVRRAG